MIRATAKLVDRQKVDELVVEVVFTATISELRALANVQDTARWPSADFHRVITKIVDATVDRVERAQSVDG